MAIIDLRKKSEIHKKEAYALEGLQESNGHFKRGNVIEFWSGYNDDIRYRAEIAGVIGNDIYIVWDCYWSSIQDDKRRKIKIVK